MRYMWIDTETTGIDTSDSSAFQIGLILVDNGKVICERCFYLNPLSENILYHESAGAIHGYSEEKIRSFNPEVEQVKKIVSFFQEAKELFEKDGSKSEKMVIAGYNVNFDKNHVTAILERNGFKMSDFFEDKIYDVFEQVKLAGKMRLLPYLENRKLGTICKYFNIEIGTAHDALADIKATREVAKSLYRIGVKM